MTTMTRSSALSLPYSVIRFSPTAAAKPDLRSRASMLAYLVHHDRHDESSGFGSPQFVFSNCVKLHSLQIRPSEYRDKAAAVLDYQFESGDGSVYDPLFEAFEAANAVVAGFTGRSSGHLALFDPDNRASLSPSELRDLPLPELRELTRLVLAFDALSDDCVTDFMGLAVDYQVISEEFELVQTVTRLALAPLQPDQE